MKIGIPRALLYYKHEKLWTTFFDELGIDYIISPDTNREIIRRGSNLAIDEACLPTKLLLGHVDYLLDKCDYIFLPRISSAYGYQMCTKFLAQVDLVKNTFRDENINLLFYNLEKKKPKAEGKAFKKMGKYLRKCLKLPIKKRDVKRAYLVAKHAQMTHELYRQEEQEKLLATSKKNKVLVVAHAYNIGDKYVGEPVVKYLEELGCQPIIAEYCNPKACIKASKKISKTLPWGYNKHLVGAIELNKDKVDGIVLLTTFPCGPDSMINEMIIRKIKDIPILTLTVDSQDGTAGMETRVESYVDIINFRKERTNEE